MAETEVAIWLKIIAIAALYCVATVIGWVAEYVERRRAWRIMRRLVF